MSAPVAISTNTLSVTLPDDISRRIEQMSREQGIEVPELLRRALRSLELDDIHRLIEAGRPQASRDAMMKQEDEQMEEIVALVKEIRRQNAQERKTA